MEIYLGALVILTLLAVSDLMVGVSNDAVNFLNSSFGSKVAPRFVIMIIASLGILAGVTFSSGMMEVARKGIFHPKYFLMPELMVIFLAVMLTDILLLDLYNTFGLPTSTTVSIVFELLGAAVAVSVIKIINNPGGSESLGDYINSAKALAIISGILLSVIIAFLMGAIAQFFTRLIFTFDYRSRLKKYGGLWGGVALSLITYFILIKGAKGTSFMTPDVVAWIKTHWLIILGACFAVSALVLQALVLFTNVNILKPIVLIGTFALAMAFAANDLVNFIGVPLAGMSAYKTAAASDAPLSITMSALQGKTLTGTWLLLLAGGIMVVTLWVSRKARTVTKTEINLGRQDEGLERFGSSPLSRVFVRMFSAAFNIIKAPVPVFLQEKIAARFDLSNYKPEMGTAASPPSFDLLRASVNLMVASAVVSFATSLKLPLSTTYVTFMVAMGTSLADRAWGRESAVYRVTGVLTVIGGWFFTAFMAFTVAFGLAFAVYYGKVFGVAGIILVGGFIIWRNHHLHRTREDESRELDVFNLEDVTDADESINVTMTHSGLFLEKVNAIMEQSLDGFFACDRSNLRAARKEVKKVQSWANIIIANIFKTMRLLQRTDARDITEYAQTIGSLQEIAESLRDMVMRTYLHINNQHKGMLPVQVDEIREARKLVSDILAETAAGLSRKEGASMEKLFAMNDLLREYISSLDEEQIKRIQEDSSKTRLSIMYYGLMGNIQKIADNTCKLISIFQHTFNIKN